MKSTAFLAIAFAALGIAMPANPNLNTQPDTLSRREVGGVLTCTGPNATGPCKYAVYPLDTCIDLEPPFLRNINTLLVDGDSFYCYPRAGACGAICKSPTGCTFGQVDWQYENRYNLSAIGWNTIMASFGCELDQR